MPKVNADELGRATITMIQLALGAQDPQQRAKHLSDAQMQLGLGVALGSPGVSGSGPVQSMASLGVTIMHRPGRSR